MALTNAEVAQSFDDLATLLELENANPYRVRAYRSAARVIEDLPELVTDLIAKEEDLTEYGGIGKDLAGKIVERVETGKISLLSELLSRYPKGILDLFHLDNLGPKRLKTLHDLLGISTLKDLEKAAKKHQIQELKGFGEKTETKLMEEVQKLIQSGESKRLTYFEANLIAERLVGYLKEAKETRKVEVAGSYRRRKETIGDLDILITTKNPEALIDYFVNYEDVQKIISKGKTRASVELKNGFHVDLRALEEESFGSGLYYFTGSKAHNIEIRKIARQRGLKINEYGVFKRDKKIAGKTEEEIFRVMELQYIPPEIRENRGEIAAAAEFKIPKLVTIEDIKGDLHCHTIATDGRDTIEAMALKAKELGREYLAITDHSQKVKVAGGLDPKQLRKHLDHIQKVEVPGIRILKGIEVDILENGTLDLPDEILKDLDIRVCSIHFRSKMNKKAMTDRILRAMDNPYFNVLGHPTGRLLLKREPFEVDLEKIFRKSAERGIFLEINCQPDRLDLHAEHCQMAQELGAKFVISTDSHSKEALANMGMGVNQARRGWVEKKNVMNALGWSDLKKLL